MTSHDVQTMVFAVQQLLEVVVNGVGVAEAMAVRACQTNGRLVLITRGRYVLNIIGGQTPETLVVVPVVVVAEFGADLQVLIDLPAEGTCDVQVLTLLLLVVVPL